MAREGEEENKTNEKVETAVVLLDLSDHTRDVVLLRDISGKAVSERRVNLLSRIAERQRGKRTQ
jgi:hypothetical protein